MPLDPKVLFPLASPPNVCQPHCRQNVPTQAMQVPTCMASKAPARLPSNVYARMPIHHAVCPATTV
eukprot:12409935-Alexandrium_andersonii.AAC.1